MDIYGSGAIGKPSVTVQGPSSVQWKGPRGSEQCVHGSIIAAGSFFFWLIKDPPEGLPEGLHRAGPPALPRQEVDEGFDAAVDAGEQEENMGRHNDVTELLQDRPEKEGESEEHNEENNDLTSLGFLLLGPTLGLNEFDCAGNDHGCSKEEQDDGEHGDESCPALLLLV